MKKEKYNISIIGGCGHVGLPLGIVFAQHGNNVTLIDLDDKKVNLINSGILPFVEEGAEELLKSSLANKLILATTDKEKVKESDIIVFVTGTPVDEHLNPKVSDVIEVFDEYIELVPKEAILILRSTNYPGVFNLLEKSLFEKKQTKNIAFCPERILQGKAVEEIQKLPQIIASNDESVLEVVNDLFTKICNKTIKLTPKEAEFAKLMTNSWRYLQFSIANQFYMIAEENNIDFYNVYDAIKEDYPRANNFSSPGLTAGPCLFKDTMQLSAFADNSFFIGHAAMLINEGMPRFIIKQLKEKIGDLTDKKVAILGMTFKANNDDTRDSLSFKIKKELELNSAIPLLTDIYLKEMNNFSQVIDEADAVILATPHKEYLNLKCNKPFIDCWGVWR